MNLTGNTVFLLCLGALVLALVAVFVDRINFPQKPFRPKNIRPAAKGVTRDRTGAHILEVDPDEPEPTGTHTQPTEPNNQKAADTDVEKTG